MAFPSPAVSGQQYTSGGYIYQYNATLKTWTKIGVASTTTGNTQTGATTITGNSVTTGNTTSNTTVTSSGVTTGNATTGSTAVTANAVTTGNTTSNTTVTASGVTTGNATTGSTSVTANAVVTGNTTASTTVTAGGVTTGNATTGSTEVTANAVVTGNATASTTVTAGGVTTGNTQTGSTSVTANAITTGNTTASTTVTSSGVTTGNATTGSTAVTANAVTTGNATTSTTVTAGGVTTGNATTGSTSVTANAITTGNTTASTTVTSSGVTTGNATTGSTTVTANSVVTGNSTSSTTVTSSGVTTGNTTTGATTVTANSVVTGNTTSNTTVTAGSVTTANIVAGNISASQYYFANGMPFTGGLNTSEIATYLPTNPTIYGIQANVGAYQIYANANAAAQAISIGSLATNANANTAAYLNSAYNLTVGQGTTYFGGNVSIAGNLTIQGNAFSISSTDVSIQDSILQLHTAANLAPLVGNDGRDIGIAFHYYDNADKVAFFGRDNASGYLEFIADGVESSSNTFSGTFGTIKSGELILSNTTASTSNITGALRVSGGVGIGGDVYAQGNIYSVGSRVLTAHDLETITYTPTYFTMTPGTVTVPVVGTSTTYGDYKFGDVISVQTYGDYNTTANTGFISVYDVSGAPGHIEYFGFTGITDFSRVVLNINYTANSGHTQNIDLYNYQTDSWDTFGSYTGSGNWQQFALGVIDSAPYLSGGNVTLRNYHLSSGSTSHRTWIDYVALEQTITGGQGPRGPTGSTGSTGATGPSWAGGYVANATVFGSNLIANSGATSGNVSTGAFVVVGGAGVSGNLNVGGNLVANGVDLVANAGSQADAINLINANIGAYEIYANANVGTAFNSINSINANVGTYQNTTNANIGTIFNSVNSINANVGTYQNTTNANIGTVFTRLNTLDANVGAYETWANATFGTSNYSNTNAAAYLTSYTGNITAGNIVATGNVTATNFIGNLYGAGSGGFITGANLLSAGYLTATSNVQTVNLNVSANAYIGNVLATQYLYANGISILTGIGGTYSNANVVANLQNFVTAISTTANITTTANIISPNYLFANGVNILSTVSSGGTTYSNTNAAAYLTSYTGNITAGNIVATGNVTAQNFVGNLYGAGSGGYITGANLLSAGYLTATSNVQTVNLNVSANAYIGNIIGSNFYYANGQAISFGSTGSAYGNTEVAAYIKIDPTVTAIQANLGTYQNTTNANVGSVFNSVNSINANVGTYQNTTNANIGSVFTRLNTLDANVGAFEIYANANLGTATTKIDSLRTGANANTAAYIVTYTGNIGAGNVVATGNVYAAGYYFANGTPYSYGNVQVGTYLPTYEGNVAYANVTYYTTPVATSSSATFYPEFASSTAGNTRMYVNSSLTYVPSSGTLSATIFSGAGAFTTLTASSTATLSGVVTLNSGAATNDNSTGALVISGSGGLAVSGNVNLLNQLFVGTGSQATSLVNPVVTVRGTSTSGAGSQYTQSALINATPEGSSDFIAYGDNYGGVSADHGWMDVGYTGSTFNDPAYTITGANDGYLFASAVNNTLGGNLVLATDKIGYYKDIVLAVGGFYANAEVARFHGNATTSGYFALKQGTAATSTTTGALRVTGGVGVTGNLWAGNVLATGFFYANGTAFVGGGGGTSFTGGQVTSGIYANGNLTLDLGTSSAYWRSTYTGNIITTGGIFWSNGIAYSGGGGGGGTAAGDNFSLQYNNGGSFGGTNFLYFTGNGTIATPTGNIEAGGARSTTGTTPPANPTVGDVWYNSTTDVTFRYQYDGTNKYWVDIGGPAVVSTAVGTPQGRSIAFSLIFGG